jgi:hypothetical protein
LASEELAFQPTAANGFGDWIERIGGTCRLYGTINPTPRGIGSLAPAEERAAVHPRGFDITVQGVTGWSSGPERAGGSLVGPKHEAVKCSP